MPMYCITPHRNICRRWTRDVADPAPAERPDPEYSAQPIISLPREAENRSQTIVTPPSVKLHRDVPLPNVVAWSEKPQVPIAPAPVVLASETSRLAPKIDQAVVAPPPEVANRMQPSSQESPYAGQLGVIAPPPQVEAESSRRFGDFDIGQQRHHCPGSAARFGRTAHRQICRTIGRTVYASDRATTFGRHISGNTIWRKHDCAELASLSRGTL